MQFTKHICHTLCHRANGLQDIWISLAQPFNTCEVFMSPQFCFLFGCSPKHPSRGGGGGVVLGRDLLHRGRWPSTVFFFWNKRDHSLCRPQLLASLQNVEPSEECGATGGHDLCRGMRLKSLSGQTWWTSAIPWSRLGCPQSWSHCRYTYVLANLVVWWTGEGWPWTPWWRGQRTSITYEEACISPY